MTAKLFSSAVKECHKLIGGLWELDWNEVTLVSGGAAWMDHVAVHLWLMDTGADLKLHMPCGWDPLEKKFVDTGSPVFGRIQVEQQTDITRDFQMSQASGALVFLMLHTGCHTLAKQMLDSRTMMDSRQGIRLLHAAIG